MNKLDYFKQKQFNCLKKVKAIKTNHAIHYAVLGIKAVPRAEVPIFIKQLFERIRHQRMNQSASSLAFSTLLSLVPLFTLALALFSTFPEFEHFRILLEDYFIESLIPKPLASTVIQYLMMFSSKAKHLSLMGGSLLLISTLMLFVSIERTLNDIWQVSTPKLFTHRWLLYLLALLCVPFLIGIGFYLTIELFTNLKGLSDEIDYFKYLNHHLSTLTKGLFQMVAITVATCIWAIIFKLVPNTQVAWRHAWIGALIGSALLWILKYLFVSYVLQFGNFKQLYGAFSIVPVFLLWIYISWWVTLLGATISACLAKTNKL